MSSSGCLGERRARLGNPLGQRGLGMHLRASLVLLEDLDANVRAAEQLGQLGVAAALHVWRRLHDLVEQLVDARHDRVARRHHHPTLLVLLVLVLVVLLCAVADDSCSSSSPSSMPPTSTAIAEPISEAFCLLFVRVPLLKHLKPHQQPIAVGALNGGEIEI